MIIHIKVKPNSKKQKIEDFGNNRYLVHLKSEPEKNKANIELLNLLSGYLCIPATRMHIKFGKTGRDKIIEVR